MNAAQVLNQQNTFNTALVSKLQALATALGNRATTAQFDSLFENGKLKSNLIPFQLADLLSMKGSFHPTTDAAKVQSGVGKEGDIYVVTANGTVTADGIGDVKTGDWLWFLDDSWFRMPFGDSLNVTIPSNATDITAVLAGAPTVGNVQAALNELLARIVVLEDLLTAMGAAFNTTAASIDAITVN